ncbi:BofC C-terminal domain-containing protein [Bacillus kwashiorkori]|uniref:BofC C-terminal domain-containing protein n=1 Tax=Bacillus kwashiorkori TaxID=1522318 RepID=UPI00078431D9|nr:BofC C-terminal domain-containing protein [Bacillus kwashiorkori]
MNLILRVSLMGLFVLFAMFNIFFSNTENKGVLATNESFNNIEVKQQQMTVVLQTYYLDGEIGEEIVIEKDMPFPVLKERYKDWQLVEMNGDRIVLKKSVDDISPLLKANGYFGLSDDGALSIFNGKPDDKNIIQSFFQIEMHKLESKLQERLLKGIPIRTKDEFHDVLETYKPYSRKLAQ